MSKYVYKCLYKMCLTEDFLIGKHFDYNYFYILIFMCVFSSVDPHCLFDTMNKIVTYFVKYFDFFQNFSKNKSKQT